MLIDDGSTDNTKELVNKWKAEKKVVIEYYYKEIVFKSSQEYESYLTVEKNNPNFLLDYEHQFK